MGDRDAARAHRLVAAADAVLAEPAVPAPDGPPQPVPASEAHLALWGLARTWPGKALRLDRAVRRVDVSAFPAWRACSPSDLEAGRPPASAPLVDALAMHPDGRVRAAAVEVMAAEPASHLARLAVRCVDPAPVVRGRAVGLALQAIATSRLHDLVAVEVVLLGERMRRVSPAVVDAMERRLLADPPAAIEQLGPDSHRVAQVLAEGGPVRTRDLLGCLLRRGPAARRLFDLAIERATVPDLEWFLRDQGRWIPADQMVWLWASARWPGLDEVALTRSHRARLLRTPVAQLRGFLTADPAFTHQRSADEVVRALVDGRAAPRRMAQCLLAHAGVDVAAYYRQLLEVTPTAIVGLGEVGGPEDAALVRPLLASEQVAVRRAAVNACKLDVDGSLEQLVAALDDVDRVVARAAVLRLRRRVDLVGIERLLEVGQHQAGPHARSTTIDLLLMLPDDRLLAGLLGDRVRADEQREFIVEGVLREWRDRRRRRGIGEAGRPEPALRAELRRRYADDAAVSALLDLRRDPPAGRDGGGTSRLGRQGFSG